MAKQNLEEFAYESIIKLIQTNHFRPGDTLLEAELAEMFGLKSKTPVRHALGQLVASGFIEKRKKKGCVIPVATPEDAGQVFFARECVEGNTTFSAALQATVEDIADLREIIDKESDTGKSGKKYEYSTLNKRFHDTISRISRNKYLQKYSEHLFWRSNIYVFFYGAYYTQTDFAPHMLSPPQHIKIVEAIEKHDAEQARKLMIEHIRFTFERIFSIIKGNENETYSSYFPSKH